MYAEYIYIDGYCVLNYLLEIVYIVRCEIKKITD